MQEYIFVFIPVQVVIIVLCFILGPEIMSKLAGESESNLRKGIEFICESIRSSDNMVCNKWQSSCFAIFAM